MAIPLRVLALLEAASISGTAKAVLEMAYESNLAANDQRRMEVIVANFKRGPGEVINALIDALQTAEIPYSFIQEQGRFDRSVLPQLRDLVEKYRTDVVWTNSVKSHFLVSQSGIRRKCKWIAFHHGYTSTDLKMRLYNQLDRLSLRHADRVLTVCQPFAKQMERRGVPAARIRVQHMPIRPFTNTVRDAEALRSELSISPGARVILSIGRLSQEKGHLDLIAAFGRLRNEMLHGEDLRLVMVGDGPERKNLEQQTLNLNVGEHVSFLGHRDDAKRFYGIAAVFALPSYTEGTPNVLLEAMAAGVPVVATAVGGVPELGIDRQNALLVPPAHPVTLAAALQRVLESGSLRNELTLGAKDVVAAHTPQAYFENMRDIFWEAASK